MYGLTPKGSPTYGTASDHKGCTVFMSGGHTLLDSEAPPWSVFGDRAIRVLWGARIAQWLERQICDPGSAFCVDSYFSICSNHILLQWHIRDPGHSAKSANKHAYTLRMWFCMKWRDMVHGCKVYTERTKMAAISRGTSHVTTRQFCKYTTWVNSQNTLSKRL